MLFIDCKRALRWVIMIFDPCVYLIICMKLHYTISTRRLKFCKGVIYGTFMTYDEISRNSIAKDKVKKSAGTSAGSFKFCYDFLATLDRILKRFFFEIRFP